MADGGNILREILGERMILKGGRVAIKGKVYHHDFLNEWVGKMVEITSWEYELCPGELFYRAQPLGEELFLCLSESKLPQDREEGEVLAGRDEAIVEIREIIEQFQYDNPAQGRLVLDILECVGKLALPGYSVQVIASPVGTASGKEVGMADGGKVDLGIIAKKYGIQPGTTYYFRRGHESGLGGLAVYFPQKINREEAHQPLLGPLE